MPAWTDGIFFGNTYGLAFRLRNDGLVMIMGNTLDFLGVVAAYLRYRNYHFLIFIVFVRAVKYAPWLVVHRKAVCHLVTMFQGKSKYKAKKSIHRAESC